MCFACLLWIGCRLLLSFTFLLSLFGKMKFWYPWSVIRCFLCSWTVRQTPMYDPLLWLFGIPSVLVKQWPVTYVLYLLEVHGPGPEMGPWTPGPCFVPTPVKNNICHFHIIGGLWTQSRERVHGPLVHVLSLPLHRASSLIWEVKDFCILYCSSPHTLFSCAC